MIRHVIVFAAASLLSWQACATEVKEVTTPKGFKAWLVEEHALPLIAVKVAFNNSGYAYDEVGKEGRAGMVAALMMEGAGDMDSHVFNEALENDAIELNFATDEDTLRASVESLAEHKDKAFSYLGLALTKPRFDGAAIERVRSQTQSILTQQERQPGYLLGRKWAQVAFGDHPYGQPVLGTKDSIAKLASADFTSYTQHYLSRENIFIAVVGDITPQELSDLLDKNLSALPEHYTPTVKLKSVELPTQAKQEVVDLDVPQTMVVFGTNGLKRDDPQYYAAYVMNHILGGGGSLSAKLAEEIREKRGLAYTVYSSLDPMTYGAVWRGGFATRNEQVGTALAVLRSTLKDFAQKGPTDKEMSDAKKYLTGSFVLNLGSNGEIASYLISMQLNHLGRDYLDKRNGFMEAVKEDVKAIAAKLVDPSKLLVVMVGKPNLVAEEKETIVSHMLYQHITDHCFDESPSGHGVTRSYVDAQLAKLNTAFEQLKSRGNAQANPILDIPSRSSDLNDINELARMIRERFKFVVVAGTGGSGLSGHTLTKMRPLTPGPSFHFLENIDPDAIDEMFFHIDLKDTCFLIISKSGGTVETLSQFYVLLEHVGSKLGKQGVRERFFIITMPGDNPLRKSAAEYQLPTLDHERDVGGRYCILTKVGLLPAAIAGLDIKALRRGAQSVITQMEGAASPELCPPALGAAIEYSFITKNFPFTIMLPYSEKLSVFSSWYRQNWAESLGKGGKGSTPIRAIGTTDQHSQLQLYLDGPKDKLFHMIMLHRAGSGQRIHVSPHADQDWLHNKTTGDVMAAEQKATFESLINAGRPVRLFKLGTLKEEQMGALLMHFMLEIILTSALLEVDPFDQPAVEEGKKLTREYLMTGNV